MPGSAATLAQRAAAAAEQCLGQAAPCAAAWSALAACASVLNAACVRCPLLLGSRSSVHLHVEVLICCSLKHMRLFTLLLGVSRGWGSSIGPQAPIAGGLHVEHQLEAIPPEHLVERLSIYLVERLTETC